MVIQFFKILFSLILLASVLSAQEKVLPKDSIQTLVAKVKKAPPSQRRVLMNQLKVKLRSMNQETRKNVMMNLRQAFNKHHNTMNIKQMQTMHKQGSTMMNSYKDMQEYMNRDSMMPSTTPGTMPVRPTQPRQPMPMRGN
ncbi:MAG TPA: hypothetical protein ENK39_03980 [Epsilonproteobacteria bacterium]|nr:hypothetical protein [Campylobacterota bacterium]